MTTTYESPVCPDCGMTTWVEGRCHNPYCGGGDEPDDQDQQASQPTNHMKETGT